MTGWIVVEGEKCVAIEAVAEAYAVEVSWIHQVVDLGLLGPGRVGDGTEVIALDMLGRVAEIKRLHLHLEVELETVALLLARR